MRRTPNLILLVWGLALLVPGAANAQSEDPRDGSPSGTIYEIPLDDGRSDGAPRDSRPETSGGQAGRDAEPSSPIRSQNGFGSSSTVPGAERTEDAGPAAAKATATPRDRDSGERDRDRDRDAARESKSDEPEIPAGGVIRQSAGDASSPLPRAGLLLGLGILVAAGLAAAARLATRQR